MFIKLSSSKKGEIMKNKKRFFIIGSVGIAVTAIMQMLMTVLLSTSSMAVWLPLYLSFVVFMIVGLPKNRIDW